MKRRIAVAISVVASLMVGLVLLSGSSGGLGRFSPHTLRYQTQSEYTVLWGALPVYRSSYVDTDSEMVTFILQQGFVTVDRPELERWELIFHWNHAWKDGYGSLYEVLFRYREEIVEWSKEDPERARIYWSEGFKYLRSDNMADVWTGRMILTECWRAHSTQELQKQIATLKEEYAAIFNE